MIFKEQFNKRLMFFDGAMGTVLQEKGLSLGELPESWNISHPSLITDIHKSYLDAGADIIKANTFGANSLKFDNVEEIIASGIENAKLACEKACKGFVALDIGPSGKLIEPMGDLSFDKAYDIFAQMAITGEKAGADLVLIETMSDTMEIKAAVLAVKENTLLPVIVTMIFDEKGRLLTGGSVESAVALLEGLRVDAIGFNCGLGPKQMVNLAASLFEHTSLPVVINPNAGLPVSINGNATYNVSPKEFAQDMLHLAKLGCAAVGGCCGTTPEHIRAMTEFCKGVDYIPVKSKNFTVVSSYAQAVYLGNAPIIIGERINPTGKARFKQALRDGDINYIVKEGLLQWEKGADILDVNVGLPEIDESQMMRKTINALQSVIELPLQIDTSDFDAMEIGMRCYNGKPLINSVNGKKESMEKVFPLVKKYGGVVVALTLDENGIPDTAQERINVAKKIIDTAHEYGIEQKDIIIDTLAMSISTGQDSGKVTLQALGYIKNQMKINTVLGVSNISFGLPQREIINSTFFALALENGLSAGIINPLSESMMKTYFSFNALKGFDSNCQKYINAYANIENAPIQTAGTQMTLENSIIKGLSDDAYTCALEMAQTMDSLDIINNHLIKALDVVGKGFAENTVFLPQLLMSADAAKAAFDAIKENLRINGKTSKKGEKILIATVYGDIHDIGKNIVKVLLENYGFDVIDMGKDVPIQKIVDTVLQQNIKLVGLSALMTTTVTSMEATIKALHESGAKCKVFVGGAVLNEEYAKMINADFYAKDAMIAVEYANNFFKRG